MTLLLQKTLGHLARKRSAVIKSLHSVADGEPVSGLHTVYVQKIKTKPTLMLLTSIQSLVCLKRFNISENHTVLLSFYILVHKTEDELKVGAGDGSVAWTGRGSTDVCSLHRRRKTLVLDQSGPVNKFKLVFHTPA